MDRDKELLLAAWGILRKCEDGSPIWTHYVHIGTDEFHGEELADAIAEHLGLSKTDHPDTEKL